jgi:hypothetical protein
MENISRGEGQSSVGSAAYRHRKVFIDNRTGDIHGRKTSHKKDLFFAQIFYPENTPYELIADSETLWNAVEASEKRKDARLAKEFKIALPAELTPEQSIELASAFAIEHFVKKGIIADLVIHDIHSHNPHIHIMGATREVLDTGFGKKVREWDRPETLEGWRKGWQDTCNEYLEKHNHEARVDHRSLKVQHTEALELATAATTNEEKATWLAKAEETNRAPMRHIPRSKWSTQASKEQRAAEQAIRDEKLEEAKKTYATFKDLPLEIVVDVSSYSVTAETSILVIGDNNQPMHADELPILATIGTPVTPELIVVAQTGGRSESDSFTSRMFKRRTTVPRQDGIFKRFTLMVIDFIRDKFVWAKKPTPKFNTNKPSKYVYDEVVGIHMLRKEYEKQSQFNVKEELKKVETIERFPSRHKRKSISTQSTINYKERNGKKSSLYDTPKLRPPGFRNNDTS